MEQFIKGVPSLVAAIPLQCLHQTRPCVFSLLFAPAPVSPSTPDSASTRVEHPKPCGGWKGLYWVRWLGTVATVPSQRAVCGFGPFSFQLLFHRSLSILWGPSLHPKRRGWLSAGSCQLWIPLSPLQPHSTLCVPALGWGFLPCTAQGCHISCSSLLSSGKVHVLTSGQGHLKSHSTWALLRAGKAGQTGTEVPWSCLERRGKAKALVL